MRVAVSLTDKDDQRSDRPQRVEQGRRAWRNEISDKKPFDMGERHYGRQQSFAQQYLGNPMRDAESTDRFEREGRRGRGELRGLIVEQPKAG